MINLSRRFFCFGAAATLVVPAPKSFFIVEAPKLIIPTPDKPFDLPLQQMLALLKRLDEQSIEMSAIPRWVVCDQSWYDQVVREESHDRQHQLARNEAGFEIRRQSFVDPGGVSARLRRRYPLGRDQV